MKKLGALLVVLALTGSGAAAPSPSYALAGKAGSISVRVAAPEAAGERVAIAGRRGAQVRPTLLLQQRTGGSWERVATTRASGPSYTFTVTMAARATTYRVQGTRTDGDRVRSRAVVLTPAPAEPGGPTDPTSPDGPDSPDPAMLATVQERILRDVNAYRADAGLPALEEMSGLDAVALAWSKRMARAQQMSHNPDYSRQIPKGWVRAGENVAYGYDHTDVTAAWFGSPGHRANLLGNYTHIGIGWALDDDGTPYYTQNFATY